MNLIYETLWSGAGSGLLVSMLKKLNWFCLTGLIKLVLFLLLMWKGMGLFLRKNHILRCWGSIIFLNWIRVLILSLLRKLPPRKLEPWFVLWSLFLMRLLRFFYRYNFGRCLPELAQLVALYYSWGRSTHYSDRLLQGCLFQ